MSVRQRCGNPIERDREAEGGRRRRSPDDCRNKKEKEQHFIGDRTTPGYTRARIYIITIVVLRAVFFFFSYPQRPRPAPRCGADVISGGFFFLSVSSPAGPVAIGARVPLARRRAVIAGAYTRIIEMKSDGASPRYQSLRRDRFSFPASPFSVFFFDFFPRPRTPGAFFFLSVAAIVSVGRASH